MHYANLHRTMLSLACVVCANFCCGQESNERTAFSFDEVQAEAMRLADVAGGEDKVLLVFDIDNTLLAMKQDLGSDQWFNWQRTLPESDPRRVGDFAELLRVQSLLYAIGSMRASEPDRQPQVVRELQDAGFTILLLTSRGFDIRDSTRRELLANGYDFRQTTLSPREGFGGAYFPYDPLDILPAGISIEEANQWLADSRNPGQLATPREVSYAEGVYMTAGQHKGAMLRMLLHKSDNVDRFSHIVFVDDHPKNTKNVRDAFENHPIDVVTFRYTREDANVRRFNENKNCEQHCAHLALMRIKQALATTNVSRVNAPHTSTSRELPVLQHVEAQP